MFALYIHQHGNVQILLDFHDQKINVNCKSVAKDKKMLNVIEKDVLLAHETLKRATQPLKTYYLICRRGNSGGSG